MHRHRLAVSRCYPAETQTNSCLTESSRCIPASPNFTVAHITLYLVLCLRCILGLRRLVHSNENCRVASTGRQQVISQTKNQQRQDIWLRLAVSCTHKQRDRAAVLFLELAVFCQAAWSTFGLVYSTGLPGVAVIVQQNLLTSSGAESK
jgi:hypothetical protein